MFDHNWMAKIERGRLEVPLARLTLAKGSGESFQGSGKVMYDAGRLHLEGSTDGAEQFMRIMGEPPCAPGTMFPESYYLRLAARTVDGWSVVAERVPCTGFGSY